MVALATSSASAAKVYWTGTVNNYWDESGNWTGQDSSRPLPTNDEMFFNRDGTYTNNEVVFTNACINNWRTFVNGVGTAETPLVFRATGSDYGLRFGNQNWKNPSCIGDSDDAYLCLKSGTWSATYLKLDNTAQLTLTDGALLSVDSDTILEKGNCKVSVTGGARFYTAAYFAHKAGEVKVENGTLEVGSQNYEFGANAAANLLLNEGGLLIVRKIEKKTHGGTISFNGGILRSNRGSENLVDENIAVTVGAKGGTIDNNGKDVIVHSAISGQGGMKFKGGGKVTLTVLPKYDGVTTVEVGTTLVVPTEIAGDKLAFSVPEGLADGVYTVVSISGDSQFADDALSGKGAKFVLSADKKSLLCIYGDPQNTWIGGESGSLSDAAGWSLGFVPTSGDSCVINNALAASLAVGDTFAPSAITFGEGCAPVTIDGGELSGITAITNLSSVRHVFNCAVSGNEINFHNTVHCCEFRGGITVATPVFSNSPENANARAIVGDWTITSDWSPVSYNELGRDDAIGSSITVQGELKDPNNIVIYSGSVVTAATMMATSSTYPSYLNNGRLVINGLMNISTSKDFSLARTDGDNATIIAGGIVYNTGSWPWLNAKTLVLGADGINFDSSHNNNLRFKGTPTLYARDAATTLHAGKDDLQAYSIANGKTLTVCTTKFDSSESSTITIDGKILETYNVVGHYSGGMAVTGCGTLVFNSASTFNGGLSVGGTATVKVNEGCTPGSGVITLGAGTKLVLTATSKEFSLANSLKLPTEGTATLRIDGKRLRSGDGQKIATVASGTGVALDPNSTALTGRKATLRVEEGKLILNIVPDGTVIIVR